MNISLSQLAPFIWILAAILAIIVAIAVIHFFWRHILKFFLHGCAVILGILVVLALLHYIFKVF